MLAGEINRWKWEKREEKGQQKGEMKKGSEEIERGMVQRGRDALGRRETWEDCVNNRHVNEAI